MRLSDPALGVASQALRELIPGEPLDDLLNHFVAVQLQIDNIVSALEAGRFDMAGELAQAVKAQMTGVAIPQLAEALRRAGVRAHNGHAEAAFLRPVPAHPDRIPDW